MIKWNVSLQVRDGADALATAVRSFTVESRSVTMALEKAVQQARFVGLQIVAVGTCNALGPVRATRRW